MTEFQKINHFYNSSELTRKDKLCSNVKRMTHIFSKSQFDFLPETYILPEELNQFKAAYHEQ
jgi:tubulin polyglutamylase TTLL6/13